MIQIGDTIVSFDIFDECFSCNICQCKGACCVHGDAGAPLERDELTVLERIYPSVKPYMTAASIEAIEQKGIAVLDIEGELVTPLVGKADCAFVTYNGDCACCAIEKAYFDGKCDFRKPISCHLYPIRITRYADFEAVNYHRWDICDGARNEGCKLGTPLYVYLKEPLIRKYGTEWYEDLLVCAEHLKNVKR